jgi:flagellar capping protein FliD
MLYKLAGRKLPKGNITISERKMKQFMNSYNELQDKYKDLVKIIDENPELKKLIEEKMSEKNKKKFNL